MTKTLILGAVTKYDYAQIEPWLKSLKNTGYDGDIALIAYDMDKETAGRLVNEGVILYSFSRDADGNLISPFPAHVDWNICVTRFYHAWHFLNGTEGIDQVDYILMTDVKDVYFQTNPMTIVQQLMSVTSPNFTHVLLSSEGIAYKDEDWGRNNMTLAFGPQIYEFMQDTPIVNAGVIAGRTRGFLEFILNVFLVARGGPQQVPGGGGPDQAALNIIVRTAYKDRVVIYDHDSSWAAQLGTVNMKGFFEPKPTWDNDLKKVVSGNGEIFSIVHQYDRVPEIKKGLIDAL